VDLTIEHAKAVADFFAKRCDEDGDQWGAAGLRMLLAEIERLRTQVDFNFHQRQRAEEELRSIRNPGLR
jgi:hypothetical protein